MRASSHVAGSLGDDGTALSGLLVGVIDDSYVWKDRLRRGRAVLRRKLRAAAADPTRVEAAFVEIEAFAFLTGYIVRKLIEAKKLSDELEAAAMRVEVYPAQPRYPLDILNAHRIDEGYDLTARSQRTVRLIPLCNLLVHSFVFMPATDESGAGWEGFFLNSDRTKSRELIFVASSDFDLLVDEVIQDHVVSMHFDRIRNIITKSRVQPGEAPPKISLNVRHPD
jgi:hypothetical protein